MYSQFAHYMIPSQRWANLTQAAKDLKMHLISYKSVVIPIANLYSCKCHMLNARKMPLIPLHPFKRQ